MYGFFLLLPLAWMACADPSKDDPELDSDGDGAVNGEDCASEDADIYPGATELCDGVDQDCDGEVDVGATGEVHYADSDGDQFGDVNVASTDCIVPAGYVADATDCDDSEAAVHPTAPRSAMAWTTTAMATWT
jgi:Putative metal-binding motif